MDMGCHEGSGSFEPRNSNDSDLFAKISGLTKMRARVRADEELGAVEILVTSAPGRVSVILAPVAALELSLRLIGACVRLRGWETAHG